ncbi:MAG: hypothetical protein QXD48_03755 [Candidatus Aenigmatarchaeota archaeon]
MDELIILLKRIEEEKIKNEKKLKKMIIKDRFHKCGTSYEK